MLILETIGEIGAKYIEVKAFLDKRAARAHLPPIGVPVPRAHVLVLAELGPDRLVPTARRGSAPPTVLRMCAGRGGGATPRLALWGPKAHFASGKIL